MAGQYDITLYEGHATPKDIILRALPIVAVASTVIYLVEGHATPKDVILRDPTQQPETGGFPTQFAGLRVYYGAAIHELCLVAEADAPGSMGGVIKIDKNGTLYAVYLVETTDPEAAPVRVRTSTGIKAVRIKT